MATTTLSSKGQLIIPHEIRKMAGFNTGDCLDIHLDEATGIVQLSKVKSLDELSDYFTPLIKPGTIPLEDTRAIYKEREARL